MAKSYKREGDGQHHQFFLDNSAMKTFLAIVSLSLALNLVSGYQVSSWRNITLWCKELSNYVCSLSIQYSEAEDREATNRDDGDDDEPAMDISETKKCYVFGQCQVSLDNSLIIWMLIAIAYWDGCGKKSLVNVNSTHFVTYWLLPSSHQCENAQFLL